jgi:hypothetical protein
MRKCSFIIVSLLLAFASKITYGQVKRCGSEIDFVWMQTNAPTGYQMFMDLENFLDSYKATQNSTTSRLINQNGLIVIPVVFHILHRGEPYGQGYNITDGLVQSQIDVINEDYRRLNADRTNTPSAFASRAADCNIEFRLASQDPDGNPTSGILRKQANQIDYYAPTAYRFDGSQPETSGPKVESPGWPSNKYLNIWVCNLYELGYGTFPIYAASHPEEDGVVISFKAFGRNAGGVGTNKGRTATHEIGHWLNIFHLVNSSDCGDDKVTDTPREHVLIMGGCPSYPELSNKCDAADPSSMFMNFMEYRSDDCMNLFTTGQKTRMRGMFATVNGTPGPRVALLNNLFAIQAPTSPISCVGKVKLFNPAGLTPTWTVVSGPATIASGQNTNEITLQATATGTIVLRATAGNYVSQDISVNVNYSTSPLTLYANGGECDLTLSTDGGMYSSYQWQIISGDAFFAATGTANQTTYAPETSVGAYGTSAYARVVASGCGSTYTSNYVNYDSRRQISWGQQPPLFYHDQLSVAVNVTNDDKYYRWYVNDVLVKEGPGAVIFCTCDNEIPEPRSCGANVVRVDVEVACGITKTAEEYFDWFCNGMAPMESTASSVIAYPNPANSDITIAIKISDPKKKDSKSLSEIKTVIIYDKTGMIRKIVKLNGHNTKTNISLSGLPTDIYTIEVSDGTNSERKIISVKK